LCSLAAIEKALIKSDLGLTPSNDGNVIRLTVPQLTADRRKVCFSSYFNKLLFFLCR
jgi:ribosome recycling factor